MGAIVAAAKLNLIGRIIYEYLFGWVKSWGIQSDYIGAFAITVLLFTLFLKTVTFPLDLWQKNLTRKNAKTMELMKPELDKLQKKFGGNQQIMMQKQREIYKKYNYSMVKTCLPMLVTVGVFFLIFSGFNSAVKYHNATEFYALRDVYEKAYFEVYDPALQNRSLAIEAANQAVTEAYNPESFLLTKNIFVPDTWRTPVPSADDFRGTGLGKMGITDVYPDDYNTIMQPIFEKYNYNDKGKSVWNGYLILPVIALLLNILSSRLIKPAEQPAMAGQTEEQRKMQQQQQKMMQYMMPMVFGIFTMFYSTAFTLYFMASNLITLGFNYIYNTITKKKDAEERDRLLSTTLKK